jgi:hypothetical protein
MPGQDGGTMRKTTNTVAPEVSTRALRKRQDHSSWARACLAGVLVVFQAAHPAEASGTRQIGPWAVVTYDRADGRKDVAAIASDLDATIGLAVRCIDLGPDPAALTDLVGQCPREQGLR